MRAALISMEGQADAPPMLAGKTLAQRQLDFALAAGCESVIVFGEAASPQVAALRQAAEAGGAGFQAVRDSHGLLGILRADDELLAMAPGLLPDSTNALDALGKGRVVLVLPASVGVAAGFERIDADRAWAGALVVGGAHVERLAGLPPDSEPTSALLRIALQARVSERRLPDEALASGSWSLPRQGAGVAAAEQAWLKRHLPDAHPSTLSRWLAIKALRPYAKPSLAAPQSLEALAAGTAVLLAAAVLLAWYGLEALGLALLPLAAVLTQVAGSVASLRRAPFGRAGRWSSLAGMLPCILDAALIACVAFAIDGSWLHRLFPPLVLLGSLYAWRREGGEDWQTLATDRVVIAAVLAIAAAFGIAEPAIMALSLGLIALNVAQSLRSRG